MPSGGWVDGVTYVVGSVFFTSASYCQLVQAQSPATTAVDEVTQHQPAPVRLWGWLPHDRNWLAAAVQFPGTLFFNISTIAALTHNATAAESDRYVWRPDLFGSVLFLVSSAFAVLAVSSRFLSVQPQSFPWRIAWLNMLGSVLFMASAIASFVVPSTDEVLGTRIAVAGTLLGRRVLPRRRGTHAPGLASCASRPPRPRPPRNPRLSVPRRSACPHRPRSTPSQRSTATAS